MTPDSAAVRATKGRPMKPWTEITHYAGFDWARDHHDVIVVDRQGQIVADFRIEHSLAGWQTFRDQVKPYPALAVAIETNQGTAVDQLLLLEATIFPVNPLSAKSYRERKAPSGHKTDRLDAWSLAEALRQDGQQWKALQLSASCRAKVGRRRVSISDLVFSRLILCALFKNGEKSFSDRVKSVTDRVKSAAVWAPSFAASCDSSASSFRHNPLLLARWCEREIKTFEL